VNVHLKAGLWVRLKLSCSVASVVVAEKVDLEVVREGIHDLHVAVAVSTVEVAQEK